MTGRFNNYHIETPEKINGARRYGRPQDRLKQLKQLYEVQESYGMALGITPEKLLPKPAKKGVKTAKPK